jgi:uncharacterized protein (TIGR02679 family)
MAELVRYFKERPVFHTLFLKIRKKYEGLGHLGGSVVLNGLSEEEKMQLGGFFQKDFMPYRSVTISYAAMEKALLESRFQGLCWEDILACYFGSRLITKQERKEKKEEAWLDFLQELKNQVLNAGLKQMPQAEKWLFALFDRKESYYAWIKKQYEEDKERLAFLILQVLLAGEAFSVYEKRMETIPVFAAKITGNPHFFDEGTAAEKLLCTYLEVLFGKMEEKELSRTEQKGKLFYQAGMIRDDVSNFVLSYHLHGRRLDGELHDGLEGFAREGEPVQITLMTLGKLDKVWAEKETVYMVENPAVFAFLCKKYPEEAFLCGNGQIRLAVWVLMDLLCRENKVCYGGDFDPEGLLIAQKLKRRYGERVSFWGYEERYFEEYGSDVEISGVRLKKLDGVVQEELQGVKRRLLATKRAVYQEAMMGEYRI